MKSQMSLVAWLEGHSVLPPPTLWQLALNDASPRKCCIPVFSSMSVLQMERWSEIVAVEFIFTFCANIRKGV